MKSITLREDNIYIGECKFPKNCSIDRTQIKFNIFESYLLKNLINEQHKDYKIKWCQGIESSEKYIEDHWRIQQKDGEVSIKGHLDKKDNFGKLLFPNEMSKMRNHIIYPEVHKSPQLVYLYGVDVKDCFVTINYYNKFNHLCGITLPLKNNHYILFNSDLNYYFEKNKTEDINTVLTTLYGII